MIPRFLAAIGTALLLSTATVSADHAQTEGGRSIAFEHKAGNEWWVEVVLSGPDAAGVTQVEAQATKGDWRTLELKDWGAWAASFHIPPGDDVRFRAHWDDGDITSCWFTHPEGEELCKWHVTEIGRSGEGVLPLDLAIGDTEDDGSMKLFVATVKGIQVHDWTESGWSRVEVIAEDRGFSRVAVGDVTGDGRDEVYAISDFNDLYRYARDGDLWVEHHTSLEDVGTRSVSALAVGDGDGSGHNETYVGTMADEAMLLQVRFVDGHFEETVIAVVDGGSRHLFIDDAVYSGGGNRGIDAVRQVAFDGDEWHDTFIDGGHGSSGTAGVATGDLTGEGAVFTARIGFDFATGNGVWMSSNNGDWESEQIVRFEDNPTHFVLGDATNDGEEELYVTTFKAGEDGNVLHQVRHEDGWHTDQIAMLPDDGRHIMVMGDVDGDDLQELYLLQRAEDGRILQVSKHAPPVPAPAPPAPVEMAFDHRGGNTWWVQVRVTGEEPERVHAQATSGVWQELSLRDWGDWAASFHIEPGQDVRFRAMVDGTWHESCWFTHPGGKTPDGGETCGTSGEEPPPPPPSGDFDATFRTSGGNKWWVEVYVDANKPLAGVDARANGGTWHELTLRSWGAWAKSFHVPDGSVIEFRARSTDGDTVLSSGYLWPSGEPVSDADPPAQFNAAFGPKASNEWWVETLAIAERDIESVEARANGGAWHELTLRSWGSWVASFHVPEGSTIEFRAFDAGGAVSMSDGFLWPDAVPAAGPNGEWPQEGSYARYRIFNDSPGPSEGRVTATLVHHDGRWLAQCEGTRQENTEVTEVKEFRETDLPLAPTDVTPGQRVVAGALLHTCHAGSVDPDVDGPDTYDTHQEGDPVTVVTWQGERMDQDCVCRSWEAEWDQDTGLVMSWARLSRSAWTGDLEDTDAPLRTTP